MHGSTWATARTIKKDTLVRILLRGEMGAEHVFQEEPMAKYTSFRVGGIADWMIKVTNAEQLAKAVYVARRTKQPYRIIGGGSNILVSDAGVEGIVILNKATNYELIEYAKGFILMAESGVMMPKLAGELAKRGAAGFEWAVGVPGSIGGAVVQNAGAWGEEVKDRLFSIEYVTPGEDKIQTMTADQLGLRYRGSKILDTPPAERAIVLRAWFRLDKDDPEAVALRNAKNISKRTSSQPRAATGGSTFRNPPGDYAGRLIEAAGLKGFRLGKASISDQHANFIINHGGATANEIRGLIELARTVVQQKFGLDLHPEVEYVGYWQTSEDTAEPVVEELPSGDGASAGDEVPPS